MQKKHIDEKQAWKAFTDTGAVGAYLVYRAIREKNNTKQ